MALVYTPETDQQMKLPMFYLKTVDDKNWSSRDISTAPAKIIVFMCNHCPYVKAIEDRLIALADYFKPKYVPLIGICANDPTEYPEDSPEQLLARWQEKKYSFPYLLDTTQHVAKKFGAVCTPDFFVFNKQNLLVYRGRLDDSWRDPSKVTREELKLAVDHLLAGLPIDEKQTPSMGCSIKWREP